MKSRKTGPVPVRELLGVIEREKPEIGVLMRGTTDVGGRSFYKSVQEIEGSNPPDPTRFTSLAVWTSARPPCLAHGSAPFLAQSCDPCYDQAP